MKQKGSVRKRRKKMFRRNSGKGFYHLGLMETGRIRGACGTHRNDVFLQMDFNEEGFGA